MVIKVDYAVLEAAHSQVQTISKNIEEKLDTLRAGLQRMVWTGSDQAAYQEHQAAWDRSIQDINQILNEIGTAVGIARENYLTTEMSNSKLWG
jgi:early secretory antigenic target protein ESAT-6